MNSHSDHTLHFEAVNSRNRAEVEHLEVFAEQSGFIESVTQCLQEADKLELWRPIGIYDRGMLIGFAMYGYFPEPAPGQVWLDRLLIDKKYQGKGYGKRVVLALLDMLPVGIVLSIEVKTDLLIEMDRVGVGLIHTEIYGITGIC